MNIKIAHDENIQSKVSKNKPFTKLYKNHNHKLNINRN